MFISKKRKAELEKLEVDVSAFLVQARDKAKGKCEVTSDVNTRIKYSTQSAFFRVLRDDLKSGRFNRLFSGVISPKKFKAYLRDKSLYLAPSSQGHTPVPIPTLAEAHGADRVIEFLQEWEVENGVEL